MKKLLTAAFLLCLIPAYALSEPAAGQAQPVLMEDVFTTKLADQQAQITQLRNELLELKDMLRREKQLLQERKAQTERERMIDLYLKAGVIRY